MFDRTHTEHAPWKIVPANFKWYARVQAVKAVHKCIARLTED